MRRNLAPILVLAACGGSTADPEPACLDPRVLDGADATVLADGHPFDVGDIDGDGVDEVVWEKRGSPSDRSAAVHTSDGASWSVQPELGGWGAAQHPVAVVDVDGDGVDEIAHAPWILGGSDEFSCGGSPALETAVEIRDGAGDLLDAWTVDHPSPSCEGDDQASVRGTASGHLVITETPDLRSYVVAGSGGHLDDSAPHTSSGRDLLAAGDLDGDGEDEVVVATDGTLELRSLGAPAAEHSTEVDGLAALQIGPDVTGDGVADLLAVHWQFVEVLDAELQPVATVEGTYAAMAVPDLDGDGIGELAVVVGPREDLTLYVLRGPVQDTADPEAAAWLTLEDMTEPAPTGWVFLQVDVGDIDGDGAADLVVWGWSGLSWHPVCP